MTVAPDLAAPDFPTAVANPDVVLPRLRVLDTTMAYRETHAAPAHAPVALFLHGNPTSSYIWRNILPHVAPVARCIAPDLVGFGQSGKPAIDYRFVDHARHLDAFLDAAGIESAYLVAQDWGTALAFHLAARRPRLVRGLAFMEFIRPFASWDEFHQAPAARETFRRLRTPGEGERMILDDNLFVERILPGSVVRPLTEQEMAVYRAPFATRASRLPTWRFPNELPIEGAPADVHALLTEAHAALAESAYPKLLFVGDPGALVAPEAARRFAATVRNCAVVPLGAGRHYLQEDHPETIGRSTASWIAGIEAARAQAAHDARAA